MAAIDILGDVGDVIEPGDEGYDAARATFYGGYDKRPEAIVRVTDDDGVARVVTHARESGRELAVRSGGHSVTGFCVSDGGIVLDLSRRKRIEIDAAAQTAWAEAGVTAAEFLEAAEPFGLGLSFGDTGSVGLGGLVTGGGVGFLVRKYGLTIDSLLAADVVTADGVIRRADAQHEPDLFWAIRGGGGNFGVATRFQFRLRPVDTFTGGMLMQPASASVIREFMALLEAAPEELSGIVNVMPAPPMPFVPAEWHNKLVLMSLVGYVGAPAEAERVLAPFRALATPIVDMVKPMPYAGIYPPEDPAYHPIANGRTLFLDSVDASSAYAIMSYLGSSTAYFSVCQLRVLGGAVSRVANDATAYAHRSRKIMGNVAALVERVEDRPQHDGWVDAFARDIQRGPIGAYVNFVTDETGAQVRAAYPGRTYDRLAAIKARYDPTNLFRLNQNIRPA
ncbi:MAG TPA: FAD-binding oxidoreductase [Candidatus Acidoferrales bacterium]|nr:FAD-binding oxidoreductase [Candidatus Acidoferrales bacterium]